METMETSKTKSKVYRRKPCGCGCRGRDPWHQSSYLRVVEIASATATEGWVRLPMSTDPVRVTRKAYDIVGAQVFGDWMIDADSVNHNKKF